MVSFVGGSLLRTERADLSIYANISITKTSESQETHIAGNLLRKHVVIALPSRSRQVVGIPWANAAKSCQSVGTHVI